MRATPPACIHNAIPAIRSSPSLSLSLTRTHTRTRAATSGYTLGGHCPAAKDSRPLPTHIGALLAKALARHAMRLDIRTSQGGWASLVESWPNAGVREQPGGYAQHNLLASIVAGADATRVAALRRADCMCSHSVQRLAEAFPTPGAAQVEWVGADGGRRD